MVLNLLLLALLLFSGLIFIFFTPLTAKFFAFSRQLFPVKTPIASTKTATAKREKGDGRKKADLERIFATFDKNGDGFITKQELRDSLGKIGIFMTEKDVREAIEKLDTNKDGQVDFDEFYHLFNWDGSNGNGGAEAEGEEGREEELKEAFDVFDEDRDGLISVEELGKVLMGFGFNEGKEMEDCKEMIRKVDVDGDGMVNFEEFKKMMKANGRLA